MCYISQSRALASATGHKPGNLCTKPGRWSGAYPGLGVGGGWGLMDRAKIWRSRPLCAIPIVHGLTQIQQAKVRSIGKNVY